MTFSDLIENLENLSVEEKQEIQMLLQQFIRKEKRDRIYNNFQVSKDEEKEGQLNFSTNIAELKQMMEEE